MTAPLPVSQEHFLPPSLYALPSAKAEETSWTNGNTISVERLCAFCDPTDKHKKMSAEEFLGYMVMRFEAGPPPEIAEQLKVPAEGHLPGLGPITGAERLLAMATHCLLDDGEGVALPISLERQQAVVQTVHEHAQKVADAAGQVADTLIMLEEKAIAAGHWQRRPDDPPSDHCLLSIHALAIVIHDGDTRRNGGDYISHPEDVRHSGIIGLREAGYDPDDPLYVLLAAAALGHDVSEQTDPWGYFVTRDVPPSPLVMKKILENHGIAEAHAVAQAFVLLMNQPDIDGNKRDYVNGKVIDGFYTGGTGYIDDLVSFPGLAGTLAIMVKESDRHHNYTLDREVVGLNTSPSRRQKIEDKQADYEAAEPILERAAEVRAAKIAEYIRRIRKVTVPMVLRERGRYWPLHPHKAATLFRVYARGQILQRW